MHLHALPSAKHPKNSNPRGNALGTRPSSHVAPCMQKGTLDILLVYRGRVIKCAQKHMVSMPQKCAFVRVPMPA